MSPGSVSKLPSSNPITSKDKDGESHPATMSKKTTSSRNYLKRMLSDAVLSSVRNKVGHMPDDCDLLPGYVKFLNKSNTFCPKAFLMIWRSLGLHQAELRSSIILLAPYAESFYNHYIKEHRHHIL
jgi:hypothetical protein